MSFGGIQQPKSVDRAEVRVVARIAREIGFDKHGKRTSRRS